MIHYFLKLPYLFLTLFSCLQVFANDSSLRFLGPREGDPSSIIEGISTISGDYSEVEVDLVVPGPDVLVLSRFYSSGDSLAIANLGGWRFFSKCTLFVQNDPKGKTYSTSEGKFDRTYVRVGTDEGSIFTYVGWKNTTDTQAKSVFKVCVEDHLFNLANTAKGNPHSWTNQKNNKLSYQIDGDFFELALCNLGKRIYLKHPSSSFYYLDKEILPSGNKVIYEYDVNGRPVFIKLVNSTEAKTLSWIKIQYGQVTLVETSDNKAVEYHFEQDSYNRASLRKVISSHKPSIEYQYLPTEKHLLLTRKTLPKGKTTEIEYKVNDSGKNRAHSITKAISDGLKACTEFTYQMQADGSGHTQVKGPAGEKRIHYYNEDFQLTSIEEYLDESLYQVKENLAL